MPAPFAVELSGYRVDKKTGVVTDLPNASDSNDDLSVRLGVEMLREMGIAAGTPGPTDPGTLLETLTIQHLKGLRPDLEIHRAKAARAFLQYGHLGVTADFVSLLAKSAAERPALLDRIEASDAEWPPANRAALADRRRALKRLRSLLQKEAQAFEDFRDQVSHEDLLKIDITLATDIGGQWPELRVALSAKWTLRTDRAQDCVSQGAKLASQKRGRMPHYAVITAEPRPAMLKIPSDGPSVDCVYHVDLLALDRALTRMADGNPHWSPKATFDRLVKQGRLRDYDDLVHQAKEVPRSMEEAVPLTEPVTEAG